MRIFGNVGSLNLINQLKTYQNSMSKSLERITSGQGIVTPADSPVAYAMSERFRTDLVANRARQSNVQSGISLLQTGQNASDRMLDLMNDIKGRLGEIRGGTEGGPAGPTQRRDTQIYVEELLSELGDIANTTNYNEIYLFNQARMGQTRSSFMTAFGPDMYKDTTTAHGIRDTFERFSIDNMLQDVAKTFTAGMGGIGGDFQEINRTFNGGYLEGAQDMINVGDPNAIPGREVSVKIDVDAIQAVQQNFSAGYVEDVSETFTANVTANEVETIQADNTETVNNGFIAGGVQDATETFQYEAATHTQFEIAQDPRPGTVQVTATQTYTAGETLDVARINTSGKDDIVGQRIGDFEVVGVQYHHPNAGGGKIASMDLKYMGEAQNVQVEAYRGNKMEADDKIGQFDEVQQGDVFTVSRPGKYLTGTTTLRALATDDTTGPTIDVTDQVGVEGNTLTVGDIGMEQANLEVNYQYGVEQTEFALTDEALGGAANVTVNGQAVDPADYAIEGNTLTFAEGAAPGFGDQVDVTFDAGRATEQVALAEAPENVNRVFVDGQEVAMDAENGFTVEGDTIAFHGAAQPQFGAEIEVDYEVAAEQTNFELQGPAMAGTAQVLVNGQPIQEDAENGFTIEGNQLTFAEGAAPTTGDEVTVNYGIDNQQAAYQLTDAPIGGEVEVRVEGQLVDPADYAVDGNQLTFAQGAVPATGQDVQVNYQAEDYLDRIAVEPEPIEGTMEVLVNGQAIQEDGTNGFTFDGNEVEFHGTARPVYGDQVEINFQTPLAPNTYQLDEAPHADGDVEVFVNGRRIQEAGTGTVYSENFEDIQGDLTGFTVIDGTWTAENGNATAVPDNGGDTAAVTDVRMGAARIEADITAGDAAEGGGYIVFGHQNENDYFRAGIAEDGNTYTIERMVDGQAEQYATYEPTEPTGETVNLRVELNGENVKLFADDELAIDANIEGLQSGEIGMGARGVGATFDNFEIGTLEGTQDGYEIQDDLITFHGAAAPQEGDEITINYEVPRAHENFDLNITEDIQPNEDTMQVTVNGAAVDPADYAIEGDTLTFTGAVQPTYGDEVEVGWETGERLDHINVFNETDPFPNEGTLEVFKNGEQLVEGEDFEMDAGYMLLNGAAQGELGDVFEVNYQIGQDVTELELAQAPNEGTVALEINGERIMNDPEDPSNGWTVEGNTIQLHGLAVPEIGDEVRVDYQTGEEFLQMTLSQTDVNPETVTVRVNGEELAQDAENGFTIQGDTIHFAGGGIPQLGDEVEVDFGVGPLMKEFELARTPTEGTFRMEINGQEIANDAENGFTVEGRTVQLHGDAIPAQGDAIDFTYDYTGGADTDTASPVILPTGLETKIQTPFVHDMTLVGLGLDKVDLSTSMGVERALEGINASIDTLLETQVRAGAQENRLNYSLETLTDREADLVESDGEIRDAEMEKEMVNYMQSQMMANLTYSLLSQGNLDSGSVFQLMGDTMMMGGGGFGF